MDPRDFHRLAERLASGRSAAEFRTSLGRSYYAVFNVAAEALRSMGFRVSRGASAHGEVRHCLNNSGNTEIERVSSELAKLHTWRIRADYEMDRAEPDVSGNAIAITKLAADLIQTLDTVASGPARPQIQSAIAAWRRANGYA